jgi:uridine kinase
VIEPLRRRGSIDLEANLLRPFENTWYTHRFVHDRVEVILVEGIFLLRRELRSRYDLTVWIACSFETALARALARNQEGLDRNTLERDYRTVYFPAQQYHLERDQPEYSADLVLPNDRRSAPMPPRSSDPAHPAAPENPPQD